MNHYGKPVVVRGAGDIATGVIQKLAHAGFAVYVVEVARPTAIRRMAALSEAIFDGKKQVEDLVGIRVNDVSEARAAIEDGLIPLFVDPELTSLQSIEPLAVVDAVIAKRNIGLSRELAPITIALGPGFEAGHDCDAVIETMRGHDLGKVIYDGFTMKNTGIPGPVGGYTLERVVRAPHAGKIRSDRQIGEIIRVGETLLYVDETPVAAPISGVIRGLLRDGFEVTKGFKSADIDPRIDEQKNCYTISDKARALGGGVVDALFFLMQQKGLLP